MSPHSDQQQQYRQQQREQSHMREEEQATTRAIESGFQRAERDEFTDVGSGDIYERLTDSDLIPEGVDESEYEQLEEALVPHMSGSLVTTFHNEEDRQKLELQDIALARRIILEREYGRLCKGPWLEVAQGVNRRPEKSAKPRFTEDEKRVITSSITEVRTAMRKLGIEHMALDKIADTTVETKTERIDERGDGGSKGKLGKAMDKVFG